MILEFCDNNFDSLMGSGLTVIDFFSTWCGPCNQLNPVLERISEANTNVTIGKVNVVENPQLTSKFKVQIIPNIIFFKEGKQVKQVIGYHTDEQMQKMIDSLI
jgi:thioredoxin 1